MQPNDPEPVKLLCGVLYSRKAALPDTITALEESFREIDYTSAEFDFAASEYYKQELGWPIFRKFFSFKELINPGTLADVKIKTNGIEQTSSIDGKRRVNLDPGYMDFNKVVLASAKFNWQKIYLDKGIYADPTLRYEKGEFIPFESAFPDFKSSAYGSVFLRIREVFKNQVKPSRD